MPKNIISEDIYLLALQELKKIKNHGSLYKKLQTIRIAYRNGIKTASQFMDVSPASIEDWVMQMKDGNIDSLKRNSQPQEGIKLKKHHIEKIKKRLEKDSSISIAAIKDNLEKEFGINISESTIYRSMKNIGFSRITTKKNHPKQEAKKANNSKKKSTKPSKKK